VKGYQSLIGCWTANNVVDIIHKYRERVKNLFIKSKGRMMKQPYMGHPVIFYGTNLPM
jgi:hypothetical protein